MDKYRFVIAIMCANTNSPVVNLRDKRKAPRIKE